MTGSRWISGRVAYSCSTANQFPSICYTHTTVRHVSTALRIEDPGSITPSSWVSRKESRSTRPQKQEGTFEDWLDVT